MRNDRERLQDIQEAINKIEKYITQETVKQIMTKMTNP